MVHSLSVRCGQLVVAGLAGSEMLGPERRAFAEGRRGGVLLYRKNLPDGGSDLLPVAHLTAAVRDAAPADLAPLIAVDQEGGRFTNIGPPAMALPPMASVGAIDDEEFITQLAEAQARELAALGFTMSFAPVADVHTRPENPIIGDRAFATTPEQVLRLASAWALGLSRGGVLACAKHFPGHGDTTQDSHIELPFVDRARPELDAVELLPFRGLASQVPAMMSAHVVYRALDAGTPATLSRRICTDLLRGELGFGGVLFSDAMEMRAIREPMSVASVAAVAAGCDSLLVCFTFEAAEEAHAALVHEAEKSEAFRARVDEAFQRSLAMRERVRPSPILDRRELEGILASSQPTLHELARRVAIPR